MDPFSHPGRRKPALHSLKRRSPHSGVAHATREAPEISLPFRGWASLELRTSVVLADLEFFERLLEFSSQRVCLAFLIGIVKMA